MGIFDKILIVSDFDGTFYSQDSAALAKNLEAVYRFTRNGGKFTIATGRDFFSLKTKFPYIKFVANAPLLMSNGSKLYDFEKNKYIMDQRLDTAEFIGFCKIIMEKYPDIGIRFSYDDGMLSPDFNDILRGDMTPDYYPSVSVMPLEKIPENTSISKCVIVHEPEILDDVLNIGKKYDIENKFFFTKSYPRGLEAVDINCSKGKTAQILKNHLGLGNGLLFAIGDYDNDLDMIERADFGAAPSNALPHIKKAAKIITESCDTGAIADLINIIEKDYIKKA